MYLSLLQIGLTRLCSFWWKGLPPPQLRKGFAIEVAQRHEVRSFPSSWFVCGKSFPTLSRQLQGMSCNMIGVWKASSAWAGQWFICFLSHSLPKVALVCLSLCNSLADQQCYFSLDILRSRFAISSKYRTFLTISKRQKINNYQRQTFKIYQQQTVHEKLSTSNYQQQTINNISN